MRPEQRATALSSRAIRSVVGKVPEDAANLVLFDRLRGLRALPLLQQIAQLQHQRVKYRGSLLGLDSLAKVCQSLSLLAGPRQASSTTQDRNLGTALCARLSRKSLTNSSPVSTCEASFRT